MALGIKGLYLLILEIIIKIMFFLQDTSIVLCIAFNVPYLKALGYFSTIFVFAVTSTIKAMYIMINILLIRDGHRYLEPPPNFVTVWSRCRRCSIT